MRQRGEPREDGDLHLTCAANRYLYTALSWRRVSDAEDARPRGSALRGQTHVTGEFSDSLVLLVHNLTTGHSGKYRCSAHHLITGQETHLDTRVLVRGESVHHAVAIKTTDVKIKALSLKGNPGTPVSIKDINPRLVLMF